MGALLFGVVVVLDPDPAEERVKVVGNVSRREDALRRSPAAGVDQDPVVRLDPGAGEELDVGLDADSDHREVAVDPLSLVGHGPPQPPIALEGGHAVAGQEADAGLPVHGGEGGGDLGAENALERGGAVEDRRHLDAQRAERGRHLGADEAHPHHQRVGSRAGGRPDRVAVGDRPQLEHAHEVGSGHLRRPVAPAAAANSRSAPSPRA